jgi:hypothetical protein
MTEDISVTNFRRYLRINTMHPKPDYGKFSTLIFITKMISASCAKFLVELGTELNLKKEVVEVTLKHSQFIKAFV